MTDRKERCETCRFFGLPFDEGPGLRVCVAHSPAFAGNGQSGWPITAADWWCGEWKAKDEA